MLRHPPLRTGRASFPAPGSSLLKHRTKASPFPTFYRRCQADGGTLVRSQYKPAAVPQSCAAWPSRPDASPVGLRRPQTPLTTCSLACLLSVTRSEGKPPPYRGFLPPWGRRFDRISRDARPRGSQRPFERGDVSAPIRPVTGRPSLSPRSSTRRPPASLAVGLPLRADYGLTLFLSSNTNGLDLAYAPAVLLSACPKPLLGAPTAYHFGPGLQQLGPANNYDAFKRQFT